MDKLVEGIIEDIDQHMLESYKRRFYEKEAELKCAEMKIRELQDKLLRFYERQNL